MSYPCSGGTCSKRNRRMRPLLLAAQSVEGLQTQASCVAPIQGGHGARTFRGPAHLRWLKRPRAHLPYCLTTAGTRSGTLHNTEGTGLLPRPAYDPNAVRPLAACVAAQLCGNFTPPRRCVTSTSSCIRRPHRASFSDLSAVSGSYRRDATATLKMPSVSGTLGRTYASYS